MSYCIVTGAAAGNGLAISKQLSADGHSVIGIDRVICNESFFSSFHIGDVLDPELCNLAFQDVLIEPEADVYLINNAGVTYNEFPQSDETWSHTIDVNLKAPFLWSRKYADFVFDGLVKSGGIIFIGSLATQMGFPRNPSYQASKSGLTGLARSFAYDLGQYGIRSNCISPGYIHTAMTSKSYNSKELNDSRKRHMLLQRWGRPEDVANAVSFLCSDKSNYITGINLPVDGGWMACGLTS